MSNELADLFAKRFIARRDVKAVQRPNGEYVVDTRYPDPERLPWKRSDILAHIAGEKTYGHYLLNSDDTCKLFAFDVDLIKNEPAKGIIGHWPNMQGVDPLAIHGDDAILVEDFDPREAWQDRRHPGRPWLKYQMRMLGGMLAHTIKNTLDVECAVAYTGAKGIHVYGFTGLVPAQVARDGATLVLEELGCFEATRGTNFYKHTNPDPVDGYQNFTIEVFPKQDSLDGKDLGNLMRLPLGRNLKSKDPTFFVDLTKPMGELSPHRDPVGLLTTGNAWLDSPGG